MSIGIARALLRLGRETCVEPSAPPAHQRTRVTPARLPQLARHTGARRFIGSSTIDDERPMMIDTKLSRRSHGVVGWYPDRSARFEGVLVPRSFRTRVDDLRFLTTSETGAEIVDGDRPTDD